MRYCVTVSYGRVRGKARNYPYFQPCIYGEHITKDNRKVWKLNRVLGIARRSANLAKKDALEIAKNRNIPFINGIRQWNIIDGSSKGSPEVE